MRRLPVLVTLVMLLVCRGAAVAGAPMSYPCHQPPRPPVMDGEVRGDPAWSSLPAVTGFSVLGDGYAQAKQTVVQACWDPQSLYVAFVCEEPDVAAMKFSVVDGGDAWLNDGVEIFLQPAGPGGQVYQLVVTARGAKSCGEGAPDFTKVQAAAHTGPDSYSLEIRIPHGVLEAQPKTGHRWRGNFCRNIFTTDSGGNKFTTWAPLTAQFLEPEHFGELVFEAAAPDADTLSTLNRQLNDAYRQHLLKSICVVADRAEEYVGVLNEAAGDPEFGREARDLRRRWRRLQRMVRDADSAPVDELRAAALGAGSLSSASYELKYGYLIHKLLRDN